MITDTLTTCGSTRDNKADISKMMGFILQARSVQAVGENGVWYPMGKSLGAIEQRLNRADFFRINRRCIIHSQYVLCFHSTGRTKVTVCMKAGFPMPYRAVSQKRLAKFRKWAYDL